MPVLSGKSTTEEAFNNSVLRFNSFLSDSVLKSMTENLYIAGLFGIAQDGHTAGILPQSPASRLSMSDKQYASGYKSELFTRITITPAFFPHIDFAVAYAAGSAKIAVLESMNGEIPVQDQPAQLLKKTKETIIFTDMHLTLHAQGSY